MKLTDIVGLLKDTFKEWNEDKVPLWAAALAYYTIFSIAPLLLIAIVIAGSIFGEEAARGQIVGQLQGLVGENAASVIQDMLKSTQKPGSGGTIATIVGIATLLFGASGVFGQLQDALNTIWEVKPKPGRAVKSFLQSRFLSFAMVLVIGFLLLVSLVLSAALTGISGYFGNMIPGYVVIGRILNFVISFAATTLLFAAIYKFLPDVKVPWKNLWVGAAFTSLLFSIGKYVIGLYLGSSSVGSTYGAAGSLVVILIWVFYSAQILLLGAEFTQVYSKYRGRPIEPSSHAERITEGVQDSAAMPTAIDRDKTAPGHSEETPIRRRKPRYGQYALTLLGSIVTLAGAFRQSPRRDRRRKRR